ncbi:hypothetical protein KR074_012472 [Drosophila pseudoananassae]|nr:hypothetical protein KR074_012472 [Drosophila pseudoananassae]
MNPNFLSNINAHSFPDEDKKNFPTVTQPTCIGSYSISPFGSFENNESRMRYIVVPPPQKFPLPLRNQERQVEPLKPPQEMIDNTLLFIEQMRTKLLKVDDIHVVVDAAIVCTKEVLELIMYAPFENKYGWTLGATRFRGTLYLCVVEKCEPKNFDHDNLERVLKANWLRNLHLQCLSDNGKGQPCSRDVSDENNRFNGVFTFSVQNQRIIFDSPVLADMNPNHSSSFEWSDLKLRQDNMSRSEWAVHNRTDCLKWWINSFLLNLENIYIALRDENAFVSSIKRARPRDTYKDTDPFAPYYCTHFLVRLLNCISTVMGHIDNASTVYTFEYDAKTGMVSQNAFEGRNQYTFIGDWFRTMLDEHWEDLKDQKIKNEFELSN